MKPVCKQCGRPHYNFQNCAEAAASSRQRDSLNRVQGFGSLKAPPGFRLVKDELGESLRKQGDVVVVRSGGGRVGSLTFPDGRVA